MTGHSIGLRTFLAALVVVSAARAKPRTGLELGARLSYGEAFGKAYGGATGGMDAIISGQVAPWLDVGYRVVPELGVGLYGSYGFGRLSGIADECDEQVDCSLSDLRVGLQLAYHPRPGQLVDPWLGFGFGYEWLNLTLAEPDLVVQVDLTNRGWEFANLQAGLDVGVVPGLGLGPFVALTFSEYSRTDSSCSGACTGLVAESEDIEDTSLHHWLFFGVRATFVFDVGQSGRATPEAAKPAPKAEEKPRKRREPFTPRALRRR